MRVKLWFSPTKDTYRRIGIVDGTKRSNTSRRRAGEERRGEPVSDFRVTRGRQLWRPLR